MYQTIQKQAPFAAAQEDRAGLFSSAEAEKKDRSGLPWTGRPVFLQRQNMQQESSPQNLQSTKNLPVQMHPVVQRKYFDSATNKIIVKRPRETPIIEEAKSRAKSRYPDNPEKWTAHHKFPWKYIKRDIEKALRDPLTNASTLSGLEAFANKKFPIAKRILPKIAIYRKIQYDANEENIDEWIEHVCWSPKNIFIGPLSKNRADDPSNCTGGQRKKTALDAHYTRSRSKSIRSAKLTSIADLNLSDDDRSSIENMEQSVADYKASEWVRYTLHGNTYYYQKNDPYFEECIQHVNVQYLYYADISKEAPLEPGKETVTKYKLHFETLNVFHIDDVIVETRGGAISLYKNEDPDKKKKYNVSTSMAVGLDGSNSTIYTILLKLFGENTEIYNVKAVIMNGSGKTVECPIRSSK